MKKAILLRVIILSIGPLGKPRLMTPTWKMETLEQPTLVMTPWSKGPVMEIQGDPILVMPFCWMRATDKD